MARRNGQAIADRDLGRGLDVVRAREFCERNAVPMGDAQEAFAWLHDVNVAGRRRPRRHGGRDSRLLDARRLLAHLAYHIARDDQTPAWLDRRRAGETVAL